MRKKSLLIRRMKVLTIFLLAAVCILSACTNNQSTSSKEVNQMSKADSEGFKKEKFDPAVSISTAHCNNNLPFRDGESIEDNVHTKWAKEELGINIEYDWTTNSEQCGQKVRLAMAANQELPDAFVVYDKQLLGELIQAGKVMDISQAFDEFASDQVKDIYSKDSSYWYPVSKDGAKYGLPLLNESSVNDPVLYYREDWLKELGLKVPTNFDELEKVMDEMLKADLNGDGKKDAPLAMAFKNDLNPFATWMSDSSWVFGGYGVIPGYWNTWNKDGKLEYGSIQPEVKEALARLNKWFEKGYISADSGLHDERTASEQFTSQKSGIVAGPNWMYKWPIQASLMQNNPDAKVTPALVPSGPEGVGRLGTAATSGTLVVSKDFKHIDALMLYINKLFEYSASPEGSPYENGWAEGYDYVVKEDGTISKDRADFPDEEPIRVDKYFITEIQMIDPFKRLEIIGDLYNGKKPQTPLERSYFSEASKEEQNNPALNKSWQSIFLLLEQKDQSIQDLFLGAPTETMLSKGEALRTLEIETFISIIYGKTPVSEFDDFVKKWREMGGDQITQEVNEWYESAAADE